MQPRDRSGRSQACVKAHECERIGCRAAAGAWTRADVYAHAPFPTFIPLLSFPPPQQLKGVLVANKIDLEDEGRREVWEEDGLELATSLGTLTRAWPGGSAPHCGFQLHCEQCRAVRATLLEMCATWQAVQRAAVRPTKRPCGVQNPPGLIYYEASAATATSSHDLDAPFHAIAGALLCVSMCLEREGFCRGCAGVSCVSL